MRIAFSYIRFSSAVQKKGDSKRRQMTACEDFCQAHQLELETSRRFYDEGKSAYKGKHLSEGSLGKFLALIDEGRVPKGSVLIVEAFDRLSRQETSKAVKMFLNILEAGVDVVTLVDGQWYSQETINKNMGQLLMSIGALWSANNFSAMLSERVGKAWNQKRILAIAEKRPLGGVCPGWLRLSADGRRYEVIPDRVRRVRLIFWLTLRGWGKQRVAKLFNSHPKKVPTWGVRDKRASAWHYSYIHKILTNRSVLGELVPHSTISGDGKSWQRRPTGPAIRGYYPEIIDETTFLKVQHRGARPKAPLIDKAANLFTGIIRDGDHPEFSMWYKDHGDKAKKWVYLISDYRRAHPDAPMFSWPYASVERLVLNYLVDMDWSALTAGRAGAVRKLRKDIEDGDAHLADIGRQLKRLVDLAKIAGDLDEVAAEMQDLRSRREELREKMTALQQQLAARQAFSADDAAALIRELAADRDNPESRKKLRDAIRTQVDRIELFREFPGRLLEGLKLQVPGLGLDLKTMLKGRAIRILFRSQAERWVVDDGGKAGYGVRFDGAKPPSPRMAIIEPDKLGGKRLVDLRQSERALELWEQFRKRRKAKG